MERPMNRALQLRPEAVNGVGVGVAARVFLQVVADALVLVARLGGCVVAAQFIGAKRRSRFHFGRDGRHEGFGFHVRDNLGVNVAAALDESEHGSFARRAASAFARPDSTKISLIRFDGARENRIRAAHEFADLVSHTPSGFVSHAELPFEFFGGDAVLGSGNQEHGEEPRQKRRGGFVKDGAFSRIKLKATPCASVGAAISDGVKAIFVSALFASAAVWVARLKDEFQAIAVGLKTSFEIFDGELHDLKLANELLVVKG